MGKTVNDGWCFREVLGYFYVSRKFVHKFSHPKKFDYQNICDITPSYSKISNGLWSSVAGGLITQILGYIFHNQPKTTSDY